MKSSSAWAAALQGIAESKIFFVSNRGGVKEIWQMDYDGANQKQLTHVLNHGALAARFAGWLTRRVLRGIEFRVANPDVLAGAEPPSHVSALPGSQPLACLVIGRKTSRILVLAFRAMPKFMSVDVTGGDLRRLTNSKGPDVSPTFNPKTNAQIAWVSGRTGFPQIYTMASDGTNVVRLTDQGYAVSPSWSPNGQFLAFAWIRNYGPGAPGASDIYVMDVASKQWVQLTHDGGRNDFPSWSPDGRHIVFQSSRSGRTQIWSMLADGSQVRQLTNTGENTQPNWSFK